MVKEFNLSENDLCECGHSKGHHQYWGRSGKITKCVDDYLNCRNKRTCRCKKFKLAGKELIGSEEK